MSIELHCPQCQKLIRAPDSAGGKRGKCPHCGNVVYVPTPPDESEEIRIAPIDEEEERRAEELRREAVQYAASVDRATDTGKAGEGGAPAAEPQPPGEVVDLSAEVEAFVLAMRDSKLDEADAAAARLKRAGSRARDHVQGLLMDQMPLQVEGVPEPVVHGFLKALLARVS